MATTERPVVCDAGPIIHLDELTCLDLLQDLGPLLIPRQVWTEATRHRPQLAERDLASARIVEVPATTPARLAALSNLFGLHIGERAALALMESADARLLLCDDSAARLAAESLGFEVHGTIGVIVRAIRRKMRTREQVLSLLRELPQRSTLHLSSALLQSVITRIEQAGDA